MTLSIIFEPLIRVWPGKRITPEGSSMATKKKATSKKGKIRNLPKSKEVLTSSQAKAVKGGNRKSIGVVKW
jgi:hypothetical protein